MTQADKLKTKEVILQEARLLFSQHGFNGTSVRMIAEKSKVNLAAINYHFGSKEGLYWSVIDEAMDWMDQSVITVIEKSKSIEDIATKLFSHLRENSHYVVSTMKTYLSDLVPPPDSDHPYIKKMSGPSVGPPGGAHILKFIQKKHPNTKPEAATWMVHCLFSQIIHLTTLTSSSHYENIKSQFMPIEMIEKNLKILAKALIRHTQDDSEWP